jgi:phage shock protein A
VGVLSRFSNYIKTVMSSFLDRAEDPGQTLDYSYQKQLEQLQNLRRSIADVVTSEKRLELQQAQVNTQIDKLDGQARQAVTAGRDDLARMALERKQSLQQQVAGFDTQITQLKDQQQKFVVMEQRLSSRVESFRTQKEMVKAQYGAAQAQVKIQEAASGISEEMSDVNLAVERAQDKVLQMQLAQISGGSQVDQELAQLKAQAQLPGGGQQGQAQLPPPPAHTND